MILMGIRSRYNFQERQRGDEKKLACTKPVKISKSFTVSQNIFKMGSCYPCSRRKTRTIDNDLNECSPSIFINADHLQYGAVGDERTQLFLMSAYTNDHMRQYHKNNTFPEALIPMIHSYFKDWRWKWDIESNKDNRLTVSDNGLIVQSSTDNYITGLIFTTIFMDHWITEEGRYWFKFQFHGTIQGTCDEISIGVISKDYDIANEHGIGADRNGWSWYVWSTQSSSIYLETFGEALTHGLNDGDTCIFEVIIQNGKCRTNIYLDSFDTLMTSVEYDTVQSPVKVGVSINTKIAPVTLSIVEQDRPLQV